MRERERDERERQEKDVKKKTYRSVQQALTCASAGKHVPVVSPPCNARSAAIREVVSVAAVSAAACGAHPAPWESGTAALAASLET